MFEGEEQNFVTKLRLVDTLERSEEEGVVKRLSRCLVGWYVERGVDKVVE